MKPAIDRTAFLSSMIKKMIFARTWLRTDSALWTVTIPAKR
jgi:hypothetical protein